ncbi:MAG TPA: Uma2 family endonuclease [Kofleriaceae bacterium]|nr:Uma2 family endonuclease [Kofleriaceae bacterium]
MAVPTKKRATLSDLLAVADHDRLEIIDGDLVEKALPSWRHARAETKYGEILAPFNRKAGGPRGPGGWWIGTEVHVGYGDDVYCHDIAGWRRDRVPEMPDEFPISIRPDWVCEIVSPKHEKRDFVTKPQTLLAAEVPYYWILHPEEQMLIVQRWTARGYLTALSAGANQTVRAQPFDAIEIRVAELFGDDDEA